MSELIHDSTLAIVEEVAREAAGRGDIVTRVFPESGLAMAERIRAAEAERDSLRAELEKAQAENKRLHASLASLGWRPVECGVDGYRCGLCVACGGHESEPPPIVVEVAK